MSCEAVYTLCSIHVHLEMCILYFFYRPTSTGTTCSFREIMAKEEEEKILEQQRKQVYLHMHATYTVHAHVLVLPLHTVTNCIIVSINNYYYNNKSLKMLAVQLLN